MLHFDPLYLILVVPGLIVAGLASLYTQTSFSRYSRVGARSGLTGAQAARRLLDGEGLQAVSIEAVQGFLSDHYDPRTRTLRLSPAVYGSRSLASIGVACHEAGHAIQHARAFAPLMLRSQLVPAAQIGSNLAYVLFFAGFLLQLTPLMKIGAIVFSVALLFALVTLPVEWDASARARRLMVSAGIVAPAELPAAARVLNAAFMTYVAAALMALLQLLYYLARAGLLGRRRD